MQVNDYFSKTLYDTSFYFIKNKEHLLTFINTYISTLNNLFKLENKDKIIYISGPVTNVPDYKERFDKMELITYRAFASYNIFVINPMKVLDCIKANFGDDEFSYMELLTINYCLLSLCNTLVFDNRDERFKSSIGTFSEISFAIGKGMEVLDFRFIENMVIGKNTMVAKEAIEATKESIKKKDESAGDTE